MRWLGIGGRTRGIGRWSRRRGRGGGGGVLRRGGVELGGMGWEREGGENLRLGLFVGRWGWRIFRLGGGGGVCFGCARRRNWIGWFRSFGWCS